jgi:predicted nuclease of restriction endonuclease-like (RecB) superfamily
MRALRSSTAGAETFSFTKSNQPSLHQRQGRAVTNFDRALPSPQSELAQQITKDPYKFDFLMLATDS